MTHPVPIQKNAQKCRAKQPGISLLEMAMVMIVVSVAILPVMQMLNGARTNDGSGPADRITGYKSKEALMANTMIEQALAGDYGNFNCGAAGSNAFNPDTDFPASGTKKIFNRCTNTSYNQSMYYQWTMYSVPNLPVQNQYYRASLNVYNVASGGAPILTLQTNFFRNQGAYTTGLNTTGIMLALDTSGSMTSAKVENAGLVNYNGIAAPYMFYRYDQNLFEGTTYTRYDNDLGKTYTVNFSAHQVPGHTTPANFYGTPPSLGGPGNSILDMWNNSQLDMGLAQAINTTTPPFTPDFSDPNPATVANDKFPYSRTYLPLVQPADPFWGQGILGTGNCGLNNDNVFKIGNDSSPILGDKNIKYAFLPEARDDQNGPGNPIGGRYAINRLCQPKTSYNTPFDPTSWTNTANTFMSRIEAARSGALSMLLTLEQSPSVASTMQMGFIPWNGSPDTRHLIVPESPQAVPGLTGLHFVNMRKKLLWINRANPSNANSQSPVKAGGSTQIHDALAASQQQLMAQPYGHRIIVLLTDGTPNPNTGSNSQTGLVTYVANNFGNNVSDDKQITLFTIMFIGGDAISLNNMANSTPGGQFFPVTDLSQLNAVFESISYSIQKISLLNTAKRYGISL
jgi:uncharacterized protein YegL